MLKGWVLKYCDNYIMGISNYIMGISNYIMGISKRSLQLLHSIVSLQLLRSLQLFSSIGWLDRWILRLRDTV